MEDASETPEGVLIGEDEQVDTPINAADGTPDEDAINGALQIQAANPGTIPTTGTRPR